MACSAEQKHKNKLSQTLANTLATVTKEQNWSKHLKKFSVIARQNKARGKNSIQLVTQATHKKKEFQEKELGQCGILIHASWEGTFPIFHCAKVSFGSMVVFQRANSHPETRIDVWRRDVLGSVKTMIRHIWQQTCRRPRGYIKDMLTLFCGSTKTHELIPTGRMTKAIILPFNLSDLFFRIHGDTPRSL